jgi:membrane associated rhomboid family serine protease
MSWFAAEENHQPLHYWKGHAIWLTTWVAIIGAASMIVTALLGAVSVPAVSALIFNTESFLQGAVWSVITYPLVNFLNLWFLLTCYILWQFGSSVEQHLGRRSVAILMLGSVLVPPLLCFLLRAFTGRAYSLAGLDGIYLGIFIAFATLYPHAMINIIVVSIQVWIFATILIGFSVLSNITQHDIGGLVQLLLPVTLAYLWVKHETGSLRMSLPQMPKRSELQRGPRPIGAPAADLDSSEPMALRYHREPSLEEQIDSILDKISDKGMDSLNEAEKKLLERHSRIQKKRKER